MLSHIGNFGKFDAGLTALMLMSAVRDIADAGLALAEAVTKNSLTVLMLLERCLSRPDAVLALMQKRKQR